MKVFGYQKDSDELIELQDVSFQSNIKELNKIITFLQNIKEQHSKLAGNKKRKGNVWGVVHQEIRSCGTYTTQTCLTWINYSIRNKYCQVKTKTTN